LIEKGLQFADYMERHFLNHDPELERALKFQQDLNIYTAGYKELYKTLAKQKMQKKITDFLIRKDSNDVNNSNNKDKTFLASNVLGASDISSDESDFCSLTHKRGRKLSSSDE